MLKKFAICAVLMSLVGCTYIDAGYVGIKVNSWGTQRGVGDYPVLTGRVIYNPMTETIHEFPTYMQNVAWTKSPTEGSPADDSISFNSKEGAVLNADVALSFTLDGEKVPHLFVEFRKDIDVITKTYLRNKVRDAINNEASNHNATEIFGGGRQLILDNARKSLENEIRQKGFIIDTLTFMNEIRADERVKSSINSVIEASQRALEAEQKVKQITAEAEQKVETAKGEAESILLKAKADAEANELLAKSLSPQLMQYEALRKWDGVLPKFTGGGAVPFVNLDEVSSK